MKRGEIIINGRRVTIVPVDGTVWLSDWQIAQLFEVFQVKVSSNIRSILKSDVLRVNEVCCCHRYANGGCVDLYNLDMIIALAYRIDSYNSRVFQEWLVRRAIVPPICFNFNEENTICLN